jgi:transcription elongation factor Elf1
MAPSDRLTDYSEQEEDEKKTGRALGTKRKFDEFECPACSANNPFDTFGNGDEVLCNWCGMQFKAVVDDEGSLRLKEL